MGFPLLEHSVVYYLLVLFNGEPTGFYINRRQRLILFQHFNHEKKTVFMKLNSNQN